MNTIGSYKCVSAIECPSGRVATEEGCKGVYILSPTILVTSVYTDINECEGDHGCAHECVNTLGSYECTCRPGYRLGRNGKRCKGEYS